MLLALSTLTLVTGLVVHQVRASNIRKKAEHEANLRTLQSIYNRNGQRGRRFVIGS